MPDNFANFIPDNFDIRWEEIASSRARKSGKKIPLESRRFGIEIEVSNDEEGLQRIARGLRDAGLMGEGYVHSYHCECSYCSLYEDFGAEGYPVKMQYDSSCGAEIITAPHHYYDPRWRRRIESICAVLHEQGGQVNLSCGLHVHVEARDLGDKQLVNLGKLVLNHEAALFFLACGGFSKHRGESNGFQYCKPLSQWLANGDKWRKEEMHTLLKGRYAKRGLASLDSDVAREKYQVINMMPMSRDQQTIEFRLWNSTMQPWRIALFTGLSVGLVQRSWQDAGVPAGVSQRGGLRSYSEKELSPEPIEKLVSVLRQENDVVSKDLHGLIWRQFHTSKAKNWVQPVRTRTRPVRARRRPNLAEEPEAYDAVPLEWSQVPERSYA